MRLTDYQRRAFARAVLQDVPHEDYQQQINDIVKKEAFERLPQHVKDFINNNKDWMDWIKLGCYSIYEYNVSLVVYNVVVTKNFRLKPETLKQVADLNLKQIKQNNDRTKLQDKLFREIKACSTLKQAQEKFPKLVKYLPKEKNNTSLPNLPVTTDVMDSLRELGWPKQE